MNILSLTSRNISQLGLFILIMRILMLIVFFFFSFIPFVSVINVILPQYFAENLSFFILAGLFTILVGIITITSIYTLNLDFRLFTTIIFALGIIFNFDNPYLLSFGAVLSWLFYELWYVFARFFQLEQEYSTYPRQSIERNLLSHSLREQLLSFLIMGWVTVSLSWIVLYISSNFYFELGKDFGTLGIATSFTMITIVYLAQRYVLKSSTTVKNKN